VNDHQTFRAILLLIFGVVLPIGVYHRIKSQATRESLDRRQEGLVLLSTLRPAGAVFWFGLLAWMINPSWMAWSSVMLPVGIRWAGVIVLSAASLMLVWTFVSLGRNLTDTVVTRQQHTLVLHGPYRWIRHPLYDSAALSVVAVFAMTANWFFLATGVVILGLLVTRTKIEEANLVARFGDGYRNYMKRTGKFVPKIRAQ
jgi:protein-S-isoprenylcysteine O-methyltransferase Ste14